MTLATTSAAVILWPSAIVVSPLIDSLVEPTSLDAAVAGFFSGLLAARYTTSTDVTGVGTATAPAASGPPRSMHRLGSPAIAYRPICHGSGHAPGVGSRPGSKP